MNRISSIKTPSTITLFILQLGAAVSSVSAAEALTDETIAAELQRATNDPDSAVEYQVDRGPQELFEFLLDKLAEYSEEVVSIDFDHSQSAEPGSLGAGSERIVHLSDGSFIVHRFLQVDPPTSFAYLTDMESSTADIPIDYSIVHYQLSEIGDEQSQMRVAATFRPSSRLLSMFIRQAFDSALEADFSKVQELLARPAP
jgi:hypothetical protein